MFAGCRPNDLDGRWRVSYLQDADPRFDQLDLEQSGGVGGSRGRLLGDSRQLLQCHGGPRSRLLICRHLASKDQEPTLDLTFGRPAPLYSDINPGCVKELLARA